MRIYRLTFAKNDVMSCRDVTDQAVLNGLYHYEHDKGSLIYAIVKAESEDNAITIGSIIVKEVMARTLQN